MIRYKNKIDKIFRIKKFNKLKYTIDEINNKKLIAYFFKKNKIFFVLKISFNQFTSNQFNNEKNAYKILKKRKHPFYLTKYRNIYNHKYTSISKIKYIDGKKGSFFDLDKFFKIKNLKIQTIKFEKYTQIMKENFRKIHSFNFIIDKDFENIQSIFKNEKIDISLSHGDFTHWNSIKSKNNYFIYDLEYFSKKRVFLYDILHWLIAPITNKFKLFKFKINYNYLLILFIRFYLNKLNHKLSKREIIKYLLLYFIEQKYIALLADKINKKYKIISHENLKNSKLLSKFYSNQIKIFIKYLN
tara:strand:+ start:3778 stop:4677 length:900 start_codon:yes stop_codon:yes gene_type:complete